MRSSTFGKAATAALLGLILVATCASAMAGVTYYRWTDSRGDPVHSDRPPPKGTDYEVISTGSQLKRVVNADEGAVPPETQPRVGNEFEQQTEGDTGPKKNAEVCKRARENLEALNTSAVVNMRNDQGEIVELTPEEVEIQKVKTQQIIEAEC